MARVRRLILPTLLGLAVYYAVFGGEYSLFELEKARTDIQTQERELAVLQREVDSLRAWVDSLQNDPATLERIAREKFGMIREGEILYRVSEPADTTSETGGG
jgi:cell division protein FtsB